MDGDGVFHDATDIGGTCNGSPPAVIDTYLDAYGEPDPARRAKLIAEAWADDGVLADPPMDATGHESIAAMFATVQEHFPGHRFRRTSAIDVHHDAARYSWDLVAPDDSVAMSGLDVAHFDGTGKLARVTGFLGDLPPLDS